MKPIVFLILASVGLAVAGYGQGSIAFLNPPTVKHQMLDTDGLGNCIIRDIPVDINAGLNYGIFIGATATTLSDQAVAPLATGSATAPGRMAGVPAVYLLDGTQPGQIVFAQIRAWDKTLGTDWRTVSTHAGFTYFETDIRQLEPLGPASGPGTVIWQSSAGTSPNRFYAMRLIPPGGNPNCIPEPSTWALLGLSGLLLSFGRWCSGRRK